MILLGIGITALIVRYRGTRNEFPDLYAECLTYLTKVCMSYLTTKIRTLSGWNASWNQGVWNSKGERNLDTRVTSTVSKKPFS
jgi:hypothetical protein